MILQYKLNDFQIIDFCTPERDLGYNLSQVEPTLGQVGPKVSPSWAKLEPSWAQVAPSSAQVAPKLRPSWPSCAQVGPSWAKLGSSWAKMGKKGQDFGQDGRKWRSRWPRWANKPTKTPKRPKMRPKFLRAPEDLAARWRRKLGPGILSRKHLEIRRPRCKSPEHAQHHCASTAGGVSRAAPTVRHSAEDFCFCSCGL